MSLAIGTRLGSYEVVAKLGEGGMGEVYRARDTKLDRDVAIKVLPDSFALDGDRLARFEREAKTLALLNHPNIAHVYGLERHALVMELVEGEDLSEVIARHGQTARGGGAPHALNIEDVLPIARQIAEALEAAHEQGIVHRDLKPANIKLRSDGTVKVLDFGLAKALAPAEGARASADAMNSPTLTNRATQLGVILGTAAYMAPEQARGKAVDRRADIWAFGVVLYEMLTGRRAFDGSETSDVLAAVLRQDIDWKALPQTTPPRLRQLLERCLDRDAQSRLRDIGEARIELARLIAGTSDSSSSAASPPPTAPRSTSWLPWTAAAAVTLGLIATLVVWSPWAAAPRPGPIRFAIVPPPGMPVATSSIDRTLAISPDGTRVAYVTSDGSLVVRAIDQLEATPLRGISNARQPFFSYDGRWIGFFDQVGLKKVSVNGGPALPICGNSGAPPRGATWASDDVIFFATADLAFGLHAVPAGGGDPAIVTRAKSTAGESDHQLPFAMPGGRYILFTSVPTSGQMEAMQVAVLDRQSGAIKMLVPGGSDPSYVESPDGGPGYLVYAAAGGLRVVRLDAKTLTVLGDPVAAVEGVEMAASGAAQYGLSRTGALVYRPGSLNGTGSTRLLTWVDRHGRETPVAKAPPRGYFALRLSPDGGRLALDIRDEDNDVWVWNFASDTLTRVTFLPGVDGLPVWSIDGKKLVYYSTSNGTNLVWQAADGSGAPERLTTSPNSQAPLAFSPDGSKLLFRDRGPKGGDDISVLTMETHKEAPLLATTFNENNAQISPDGNWMAYDSNEGGTTQVFVRSFPDVSKGRSQISTGGGIRPVWARGGRELFYATDTAIMAVPVQTSPTFSFGAAVKLVDARPIPGLVSGRHYDVTSDGQRFILIKDPPLDPKRPALSQLTMVVHWITELERLVSTK